MRWMSPALRANRCRARPWMVVAALAAGCVVPPAKPPPPERVQARVVQDRLELPPLGGSGRAMVLRAEWQTRPDGRTCVNGGTIEFPLGLRLANVEACATLQPFSLSGTAQIGLPVSGSLAGFASLDGQRSKFRLETGGAMRPYQIDGLPVELAADRYYLELGFDTAATGSIGGASLSSPGGSATILIEPTEPLIYMAGDVSLPTGDKVVENAALAISVAGRLGFEPRRGLPRRIRPIRGQLFARGSVKLGKYPVAIDGEMVLSFARGVRIGANGTLELAVGLAGYSLNVELGNASVAYDSTTGGIGSFVFAAGSAKGLFDDTPLSVFEPKRPKMDVHGQFRSLRDFHLHVENDLEVRGFSLRRSVLDLTPRGATAKGRLRLPDRMGEAEMRGTVGNDRLFELAGKADLRLAGFNLVGAGLRLSPAGLAVAGKVELPGAGSVEVSGGIEASGQFELRGRGTLTPIGLRLADARVELSPRGAAVSASTRFMGQSFAVSGMIRSNGRIKLSGDTRVRVGPLRGKASLLITERRVRALVEGRACLGKKCVAIAGMEVDTKGRICPVFPVIGKKCIRVFKARRRR
ncbi:MAG: hypothetical protein KJO07_05445 [Deltaproteobacteria bacterium]|nr:hypothetical protein [Deltaproteobacteria bacterium]